MARTSSALIVAAVRLDPLPQPAGDRLLDGQEGHHVEQVVDLQAVQVVARAGRGRPPRPDSRS